MRTAIPGRSRGVGRGRSRHAGRCGCWVTSCTSAGHAGGESRWGVWSRDRGLGCKQPGESTHSRRRITLPGKCGEGKGEAPSPETEYHSLRWQASFQRGEREGPAPDAGTERRSQDSGPTQARACEQRPCLEAAQSGSALVELYAHQGSPSFRVLSLG